MLELHDDGILAEAVTSAAKRARMRSAEVQRLYGAARSEGLRVVGDASPQRVSVFNPTSTTERLPCIAAPLRASSLQLDLEEELRCDRDEVCVRNRESWLRHWRQVGRASDIARETERRFGSPGRELTSSSVFQQEGGRREVHLSLAQPTGRRTKFQAHQQDHATAARSVARTLERPCQSHHIRSTNYPTPPSSERLASIARQHSRMEGLNTLPNTANLGEVEQWFRKMGFSSN